MLGVVSVVAAVAFLRWAGTPTYTVLLAGMEAEDAAAVTAQLDTDGVPYQLEAGGATVLVPNDLVDGERLKIAAAGLPAGKTDGGWAVFDAQGMTSSSFQQQVAYQRAMEGTLGTTLTGIDGVRAATVHLAMPEKKVFTDEQQPVRASVLLDTTPHPRRRRGRRGHPPGLLQRPRPAARGRQRQRQLRPAAQRRRRRRRCRTSRRAPRSRTAWRPGPPRCSTRCSARATPSSGSAPSSTPPRRRSTARCTTRRSRSCSPRTARSRRTRRRTARPRPASSPSRRTRRHRGRRGANDYRKEQASKDLGVSRTVTSEKAQAGGVKRLTVAVVVDRDAPNAPATVDVQNLVANAVGLDPARGDTIAVSTPSFLKPAATAAATAPAGGAGSAKALGPDRARRRAAAARRPRPAAHAQAGLAPRGARRRRSPPRWPRPAARARSPPAPAAAARELPAAPARSSSEPDLLNLVDENPDEVTALLRGWLANSGGDQ